MIRPFSNSSEFVLWHNRNCAVCKLCPPEGHAGHNEECAAEDVIALAALSSGDLCDPIIEDWRLQAALEVLQWDGQGEMPRDCPSRQPIQ